MGINIVPKKKKKGGRAVSDAEGNAIASRYNRAMLKGKDDKGATPEFGRLASRPKGKTSKGKPKPARIMPVDGEKKKKDGRAVSDAEENAIASRYNRAMLKGWSDKDDTPEFGRFASKTKRMPLRKKGGSVKKYARGGGVLRKAR